MLVLFAWACGERKELGVASSAREARIVDFVAPPSGQESVVFRAGTRARLSGLFSFGREGAGRGVGHGLHPVLLPVSAARIAFTMCVAGAAAEVALELAATVDSSRW